MPVPDMVPVLLSRELFEGGMALRNSDCMPLTVEWGEPDEQGFYTPVIRSHDIPPQLDTEQEVFFLTSNRRIDDAYVRWYTRSGYSEADAHYYARSLLRYLVIPTEEEVAAYSGA